MTICVGFRTIDGIVLCSDRQHTGATGFKFEKCKIRWLEHIKGSAIVFTHAGEPEAAEVMFKRVGEALLDNPDWLRGEGKIRDPIDIVGAVLGEVYNSPFTKDLETLVGVRAMGEVHLYRTYERKVIDSHTDCIGRGDSSVIRYLAERILHYRTTLDEAVVVGSYLVSVANRYVDGCGGGPDIGFLPNWSATPNHVQSDAQELLKGKQSQFDSIEKAAGEELRKLLLA